MQALIGLKNSISVHSLYTNEVKDYLKPASISLISSNILKTTPIHVFAQMRSIKDRLHNSENWSRSPFDCSNFVCLSSKLRILGFRNNWMENRCRVVLKRCLKVIDRNACALSWLTKLTKVIGRHELRTVMKGFYKRRRLFAKKNWGKKHFFGTFWSQNACQAFVHLFVFHLMYYVETAGLVYSFKIWNFFVQIKASCDEIFISQLDIRRIVVINNSACRF